MKHRDIFQFLRPNLINNENFCIFKLSIKLEKFVEKAKAKIHSLPKIKSKMNIKNFSQKVFSTVLT